MVYSIPKINATMLDDETISQIHKIASVPAFKNISIMPDAHAGAGCCVGFTAEVDNYVCPNVVGVDIGCGVRGVFIGDVEIDYEELDSFLKSSIPLGMRHRTSYPNVTVDEQKVIDIALKVQDEIGYNRHPVSYQIGTLGGGNHFIEVGESSAGKWVFIHTGSRNFGLTVAKYYQKLAEEKQVLATPKGLECLALEDGGYSYLRDMHIAQDIAAINREVIMRTILTHLDVYKGFDIDCVHNYIGSDNIIRKGAISAYKGEPTLTPLNMRDGTVIGRGKGNSVDYNNSAPHGAGRMFGRGAMKRRFASGELTLEDFQGEMEGIFSTTVNESTFDESPYAYKPYDIIKQYLEETITIVDIAKPKYNLKGSD